MNKYLEKIAKEYVVEEHVDNPDLGNKVGGAILGLSAANIANKHIGGHVQKYIGKKLLLGKGGESDDVVRRTLKSTLAATNSTDIPSEVGNKAAQRVVDILPNAPAYMPASNIDRVGRLLHRAQKFQAGLSKTPVLKRFVPHPGEYVYDGAKATKNFVIHGNGAFNTDAVFHELGHAVDLNKGPFKMKMRMDGLSRGPGRFAGSAIGGAMLTNEKTRDYAWAAPLVASVPHLRSEVMANVHGNRLIKAHGGVGKTFRGTALLNMASYLAGPSLAAGALYGVNKLKRKGEQIDPDEWLSDR